jgi:hypothetical protein
MIYSLVENLKKLEIIKLLRELDFVESEFIYKSEMLKNLDKEFHSEVQTLLEINPELKSIFQKSVEIFQEAKRAVFEDEPYQDNVIIISENKDKNPKLKNLYRNIAKSTHPDKVNQENLTELYLMATQAYENNNLIPILTICDKLNIPYEIDENDVHAIRNEIYSIRQRNNFLETTYTWQWYINNDENKKDVVLNFIKNQIIK